MNDDLVGAPGPHAKQSSIEARAPQAIEPPPSSRAPGMPTTGLLWLAATIGALAAVLARGLEPALPGVWLGAERAIAVVKLAAATGSQLFAVAGAALAVGGGIATLRSVLSIPLRVLAIGVSGLVVLSVMSASAIPLPEKASLVVAGGAAIFAVAVARERAPVVSLRAPALIAGALGIGGMLRIGAIVLADFATGEVLPSQAATLALATRGVATASLAFEVLAMLLALAWLGARPAGDGGRGVSWRHALGVAVPALAAAGTFLIWRGVGPDASGGSLLAARLLERLLATPTPFVNDAVRGFVELTRWLLVLVALLAPRSLGAGGGSERPLSTAVALALIARAQLETPLCALALLLASLTVALQPGSAFDVRRSARSS